MQAEKAVALAREAARDQEIDSLLVELLRAPSPQTDQIEADPALRAFVSDVVRPRLESLTGVQSQLDGMGNLLWSCGGKSASNPAGLILMGYAMTFPPGSMTDPYSGKIVDDEPFGVAGRCVLGRGACEQKGALAAMIASAAIVIRTRVPLRIPLYLAVSLAGETGRHDAAQFICENHKLGARYGIVGLGTGNRVCLGNKGRLDIEIMVRGQACHSSTPWEGVDAVRGARKVMERLDQLSLDRTHPHLGRATLTTTKIESGPAVSHTLQDSCRLVLDRRLLPGEDPDKAFEAIANLLSDLQPWRVELSRGAFMYPSQLSRESLVVESLEAASRLMGSSREPFYAHASLDAGYLNRVGIETIMFGPGDLRFAHTDEEVVALREVREAARIYAAAALQLLA